MRDRVAEARANNLRPFFEQSNAQSQAFAAAAGERSLRESQERQARQAAALKAAEEARAERDEEYRKEQAARRKDEQSQAEQTLREELRANFMGHPAATEADFEAAYPRLRQEFLEEQARLRGSQFDRDLAASPRGNFQMLGQEAAAARIEFRKVG